MSGFRERALRAMGAVISPYSTLGILARCLYHRNRENLYMLKARHLTDIDVLGKRIKYIKDLARSNDASKKIFLIDFSSNDSGLFSIVLYAMQHMVYALGKGVIPVIDMRHNQTYLEADESDNNINAWEKFFKQPCGIGLDDIDGFDVYKTPHISIYPLEMSSQQALYTKHLRQWSAIFDSFLILNEKCAKYVEQEYRRLIKPGMRVLGVSFRGTDYAKMRPSGHYIQPGAEDVIDKVREVMPEWGCDYVFIKSEERKTVEKFESAFSGKVLTTSQLYYDELDIDYSKNYIDNVCFDRENDKFLKNLEYLTSVTVLSRCTCAIMSINNGSLAGLYMNGGRYENMYMYNLGKYT